MHTSELLILQVPSTAVTSKSTDTHTRKHSTVCIQCAINHTYVINIVI